MRENLSWGRSESGWKVELTSRAGGSARLEWGQFSDSSDSEEEEEDWPPHQFLPPPYKQPVQIVVQYNRWKMVEKVLITFC